MKSFLVVIVFMGTPMMSSAAFAGGETCAELKIKYCLPF